MLAPLCSSLSRLLLTLDVSVVVLLLGLLLIFVPRVLTLVLFSLSSCEDEYAGKRRQTACKEANDPWDVEALKVSKEDGRARDG
jgi:hypothetical protein